ncbi:MAG: 23S rRNA (adenine(2503)-C(2))-methyltransferase RlmN [Candidatus Eisenbacteria bacterium]|nr:23S rRNA (adenine(2503)-C(2))-methyltransferase RlmN [Candidatus Eisenbacteria bacterium]
MQARTTNLFGLGPADIAALPEFEGQPRFRSQQLARWMYDRLTTSFESMTDLSRQLRSMLEARYRVERLAATKATVAADDGATKFLFPLEGSLAVEAVWIRDGRRDTFCVSSQAGCAYACSFCATASMKAGRNLTTGEILSQVAWLREALAERGPIPVHNIVFMGMGEPLANYDAVAGAIRILTGSPGYGVAARRITVSTVGLEPEIRRLAEEPGGVRLAFSLNATTDEVRSEIMPVNRKYPFRKVFDALRLYQDRKGMPVTLEYVLLRGVNDSADDARRLAGFARSLQCKVNLIGFNPHPFSSHQPVGRERTELFRSWMLPIASTVTVRWSKGREIEAACGQLASSR